MIIFIIFHNNYYHELTLIIIFCIYIVTVIIYGHLIENIIRTGQNTLKKRRENNENTMRGHLKFEKIYSIVQRRKTSLLRLSSVAFN